MKEIMVMSDKVIIRPIKIEKVAGDFVIAGDERKKPSTGEIVAVGEGIFSVATGKLIPMQCEVGDIAYYESGTGREIPIEGETYLIMRQVDIDFTTKNPE